MDTPKYANDMYLDFMLSKAERDAVRYLAQKRHERHQRYTNIFLAFSITFIVTVTIGTSLILWADALA